MRRCLGQADDLVRSEFGEVLLEIGVDELASAIRQELLRRTTDCRYDLSCSLLDRLCCIALRLQDACPQEARLVILDSENVLAS